MKFTEHERDLGSLAGAGDDLDYMHARYYSPFTGRFLSVDPVLGRPKMPQNWNRYGYAFYNPARFVDLDGKEPLEATLLQFFNTFFADDYSRVNTTQILSWYRPAQKRDSSLFRAS